MGRRLRWLAPLLVLALLTAACGSLFDEASDETEPLPPDEAKERLGELADDIDWQERIITESASIELGGATELSDTLPPIDQFPIVVQGDRNATTAEIWASTEKSGEDTDGWLREVAEDFNDEGVTLSDGSRAAVDIRSIASGTAYQFIAGGRDVPAGYSPSNQLWIEMAATETTMTEISPQLVPNVAGLVMKDETAEQLRNTYPTVDAAAIIDAVINGEIVMGYTNPFASSTGLNFLLTVLDEFAEGDESRLTSPDVASVFEEFQQRVPFVALTTLQLRDSVENESGTLDAFVMEWQTFTNTDELRDGFQFFPFGVRHDNPLYAVGTVSAAEQEVMEAFAAFATSSDAQNNATGFGFDPPDYTSDVAVPSGETLIEAQGIWKEKKDGGRPVTAVFVVDKSGSMLGTRMNALRQAMSSATGFIGEENSVGVVEFDDTAYLRLPIDEFDLNQEGRFTALTGQLEAAGGTAMYDGIVLGLDMLNQAEVADPDTKPILIVLTDGEVTDGLRFDEVDEMIAGLRIPVYTIGFEANLAELGQLSSLVEAASVNASEDNVEFQIASLFNATV
ncbi:MAG: VWA domain-containing protein [Acidimicrobiia bacterium]|nr:VWA domain-containing protein [Acidimicrobiia bacterium]